ncbi:hypothetical protein [Gorillibacterium sp. sgz5001074]|uniref:hypothetical protein n=1 Tax=Gorillibacterium sp. sgz5001074 TaxID=3446695 RepID=UPI003F677C7F
MNLAEMLCYADIHELSRIARNYDCECSSHSKNDLIQSILSTVNRKDVFESLVTGLESEDIRFLNSLLFDRRETFSLEELVARASQTLENKNDKPEWNPRELITRFKQRGWLFNGYSQQTKYLFRVPEDLKRRFSETLARYFAGKLVYAEETPRVYRDEQNMLADDLVAFLKQLEQQDLPLNPEGFLYKRSLQQVLEGLAVREEQVAKTAWRFGYGRRFREYPTRFSYLYDYCYYQGFVEEFETSLRLTEQGALKLVEGRKDPGAELYGFWLKLYRGPVPNLLSLVHWIDRLADRWVTASSLGGVLVPLIKPYYYDTPQSIFEQRLLPMLMHLGLLRIGMHETLGSVVQMTKYGSSIIRGTYVPEEETIDIGIGMN